MSLPLPLFSLLLHQIWPLFRVLKTDDIRVKTICQPDDLLTSILDDCIRIEQIPEEEEDIDSEFTVVLASVSQNTFALALKGIPTAPFLMAVHRSDTGHKIIANICKKLQLCPLYTEQVW